MTLDEKIKYLEENLSLDPNFNPALKRETEACFYPNANNWLKYYEMYKPDNGYELRAFNIIVYDAVYDILALLPKGILDNVPYFNEYHNFETPYEAATFIQNHNNNLFALASMSFDKALYEYDKQMHEAEDFLRKLIAWKKCAVISVIKRGETIEHGYRVSYTDTFFQVPPLGEFVLQNDGSVKFEFVIPELAADILKTSSFLRDVGLTLVPGGGSEQS